MMSPAWIATHAPTTYTLAARATTTAFDPFAANDADAVSLGVVATGAEEAGPDLPRDVTLGRPHPNPAAGPVAFRYGTPAPGRADLRVYDLLGRQVARVLDDAPAEAGWHTATWGAAVAAGVYVVRLAVEHGGQTVVRTRRVVVVR